MKKLLAGFAVLVTAGATGCFGVGSASADDSPPTPRPPMRRGRRRRRSTPETAYALGGAHVLGIPYDEYIRRTGADWFPGMKREKVDYPAGQVQGHVLERLFPGIGRIGEQIYPGIGLDGPSVGESVDVGEPNLEAAIRNGGPGTAIGLSEGAFVLDAVKASLANDPTAPPPDQLNFATFGDPSRKTPFGESFLTQMFPVGSVVPALDYRMPAAGGEPVPHRPVRLCLRQHRRLPRPAGQPVRPRQLDRRPGHRSHRDGVHEPEQGAAAEHQDDGQLEGRRRRRRTWFPNSTFPWCWRFKYLGYTEDTLNQLDAILMPRVNAGYSRNDDPATAPVQVDPVHGFDPRRSPQPANEATFGGGADPISQLVNGAMSVLSNGNADSDFEPTIDDSTDVT